MKHVLDIIDQRIRILEGSSEASSELIQARIDELKQLKQFLTK